MLSKEIPTHYILPILAASSVLRKQKIFKELLFIAKEKRIPAGKIYETLLQTYLFAGFPSALNSLKIFNEIFPLPKKKNKILSYNELIVRGEKTCKKIYGNKFEKLINNVNSFSPELAGWLIIEGYGKVLSRRRLSLKERELSIIAVLTVLKFDDQLFSHINGAFRLGVKEKSIRKIFDILNIFKNKSYPAFGEKVLKKILI